MRTMVVIPPAIAMLGACGWVICAVLGNDPHVKEMIFAAVASLLAGELACVPMIITRHAPQATVAQAGLVSTMLHLFANALLGGAMIMLKPFKLDGALVYWLAAMYLVSLIVLVIGIVRAIQAAPVAAAPRQP
jgi:hypothetical protein